MRRSKSLPRFILAAALTFASVAGTAGCEDENDPKTWVSKLPDDAKRTGAIARLRQLFQEQLTANNNNAKAPPVRQWLDTVLPNLVTSFNAHPDDIIARKEAMEILAYSDDPRALPALVNGLSYRPNNTDSERIAVQAIAGIKRLAPTLSDADKNTAAQALLGAVDRAQGTSGSAREIRINAIQTLGELHATSAVEPLSAILSRPLADQVRMGVPTARAAADALGKIGDPRATDALIYGLFININQQNVFLNCERALVQVGAAAAVPKLLQLLNGQNQQVTQLLASYSTLPNAPEVPPGFATQRAAEVLRVFASPDAVDPLLAALNNRQQPDGVRGAAAEALAATAVSVPAQKQRILQAVTAAFNENRPDHLPEGHTWSATLMASPLAVIGDASSVPVLANALRYGPITRGVQYAALRVQLLGPLALLIRHNDVATFDGIAREVRSQLEGAASSAPEDERADIERQTRPYLTALDGLNRVASVSRDCNDGDLACYRGKLADSSPEVVRKAGYMLAWTAPPDQQEAARAAILERINNPDISVRRSLMNALDTLSPHGCPQCIERLNALIEQEKGSESKALSHLDAQMLIARLRAKAGA